MLHRLMSAGVCGSGATSEVLGYLQAMRESETADGGCLAMQYPRPPQDPHLQDLGAPPHYPPPLRMVCHHHWPQRLRQQLTALPRRGRCVQHLRRQLPCAQSPLQRLARRLVAAVGQQRTARTSPPL